MTSTGTAIEVSVTVVVVVAVLGVVLRQVMIRQGQLVRLRALLLAGLAGVIVGVPAAILAAGLLVH